MEVNNEKTKRQRWMSYILLAMVGVLFLQFSTSGTWFNTNNVFNYESVALALGAIVVGMYMVRSHFRRALSVAK